MIFLTNWIIPLLIYSGPLLTFGLVVLLYRTQRRIKFYRISSAIHFFTFIPFIYLAITNEPDFIHALIIPAITGFILFSSGVVYLIYLKLKSRGQDT